MLRTLLFLLLFAGLGLAASAEPRYALLIGNEDYPATVGPLSLPHEDVENMRRGLIAAGFPASQITVVKDGTQMDINLAVAKLASDLRAASPDAVGFFYYSGHGGSAESAGKRANYLIPAKSPITGAEQLPILGVPVNGVIDTLSASEAKAIFFVSDACRNTLPFTSSKGGSADKGMVRVPRRQGLYIAFATADGETTPDDGLLSQALARRLPEKGLSADRAFTLALREVAAARPGKAMPFTADGLTEDICFTSCTAGPTPATAGTEDLAFLTAKRMNTIAGWLEFIDAWPGSSFIPSAQDGIVALFYEETPEARTYEGAYDTIKGPPALLEAILHGGEVAEHRDQTEIAALFYHLACQSGLGRACPDLARAINSGYMNSEFKAEDGSINFDARREAETGVYQIGCALNDPTSCNWLRAQGLAVPEPCMVTDGTEVYNFCEDTGITPVPVRAE
ncbi:MAG: caspase family protein [Hyphomonas sp.]